MIQKGRKQQSKLKEIHLLKKKNQEVKPLQNVFLYEVNSWIVSEWRSTVNFRYRKDRLAKKLTYEQDRKHVLHLSRHVNVGDIDQ